MVVPGVSVTRASFRFDALMAGSQALLRNDRAFGGGPLAALDRGWPVAGPSARTPGQTASIYFA
jgi:hypothetical protein